MPSSKKESAPPTAALAPRPTTTAAQVEEFERIATQLDALRIEFGTQAKSKPDNGINKFKLKMLNEKIAAANRILQGDFRPFEDFASFDDDALPTNSDVSFVLITYLASLERWRSAHVRQESVYWYWNTSDGSSISAARSTRFSPETK